MKSKTKILIVLFCLLLALPLPADQGNPGLRMPLRAYYSLYWISGTIPDIEGEHESVSPNGKIVYLYKSDEDFFVGSYAAGVVAGNNFIINAFDIWPSPLLVGDKYYLLTETIPVNGVNYGATGEVTISGRGWDAVAMTLVKDFYPPWAEPEPEPGIKIKFGNRLYQKEILGVEELGGAFVISPAPTIKAEITIDQPYAVAPDVSSYSIVIDPDKGSATRVLDLTMANMTFKTFAEDKLEAFTLEYAIPDDS